MALSSPEISHLLFADDNLLSCEANQSQVRAVLKILEDYGVAFGQLVNVDKFAVIFSTNVSAKKKGRYIEFAWSQNGGELRGILRDAGLDRKIKSLNSGVRQEKNYEQNQRVERIIFCRKAGRGLLIKAVVQAILPIF